MQVHNSLFSHCLLARMLGYGQGFPEVGSTYGLALAGTQFEYSEISCKGYENNLLDCPLK